MTNLKKIPKTYFALFYSKFPVQHKNANFVLMRRNNVFHFTNCATSSSLTYLLSSLRSSLLCN